MKLLYRFHDHNEIYSKTLHDPNIVLSGEDQSRHIYYDYKYDSRVEWIANLQGNTAYIDTGVKGSGDQRIECIFELIAKTTTWNCVYGARTAATGTTHEHDGIYIYSNNSSNDLGYVGYNNTANNNLAAAFASLNVKHKFIQDKGLFTLDGNVIRQYANATFTCTNATIFIFDANNNGTRGKYYGYFKLYSFKIYNDDVLVRNFIPVRVRSVGYLFDKVNKILYGNSGGGSFSFGDDIE